MTARQARPEFKITANAAAKTKRKLKAVPSFAEVTIVDLSAEIAYAKSVVADPDNSYTYWDITPDHHVVIR